MPDPITRDPVTQIVLDELRALRIDMNARLDRLVSQEAFSAEQRRVDDRHAALGQDVVDERLARKADVDTLRVSLTKTAANVRWAIAGIILPTALIITMIVIALRGGK